MDSLTGRYLNVEGNTINNLRQDAAKRERDLKNAVADFESIFIYYMLKTLRSTVPKDALFPQRDSCRDTYNMILDQSLAENLARKGGGIGLQKILLHQLDPKIYTS